MTDLGRSMAGEVDGNGSALVGKTIDGLYPAANYRGVRPRLERRRVRIEAVRDTTLEPLDPITLIFDPDLRRGRLLVTGFDLDKLAERSFYIESFVELRMIDDGDGQPLTVSIHVVIISGQDGSRIVRVERKESDARAWAESFNQMANGSGAEAIVYPSSAAIRIANPRSRSA